MAALARTGQIIAAATMAIAITRPIDRALRGARRQCFENGFVMGSTKGIGGHRHYLERAVRGAPVGVLSGPGAPRWPHPPDRAPRGPASARRRPRSGRRWPGGARP